MALAKADRNDPITPGDFYHHWLAPACAERSASSRAPMSTPRPGRAAAEIYRRCGRSGKGAGARQERREQAQASSERRLAHARAISRAEQTHIRDFLIDRQQDTHGTRRDVPEPK